MLAGQPVRTRTGGRGVNCRWMSKAAGWRALCEASEKGERELVSERTTAACLIGRAVGRPLGRQKKKERYMPHSPTHAKPQPKPAYLPPTGFE